MYGIDWDGPLPDDVLANNTIDVLPITNPLSNEHYAELCTEICPLATSPNYGIDLYLNCLHLVYNKLSLC